MLPELYDEDANLFLTELMSGLSEIIPVTRLAESINGSSSYFEIIILSEGYAKTGWTERFCVAFTC